MTFYETRLFKTKKHKTFLNLLQNKMKPETIQQKQCSSVFKFYTKQPIEFTYMYFANVSMILISF